MIAAASYQDIKTRSIRVRVDLNTYERIRAAARNAGFQTISSYIRWLALNRSLLFEQQLNAMYSVIVKGKDLKEAT
jgi:hypothetical protein